ncbi:hypothetical protein LU293_06110 [Moraxella nasovis]|uniref:hypothetical protein n=1 Tax=Moraxella nasovis TaxID=2904121 RepID=UPI001F624FC6|nr:hypothetical protein [Moraxella nasovis]UNU72689.1 hypothetical protein LU293_06110 [Moraxella nasovis]
MKKLVLLTAAFTLAGCATTQITPQYVNPTNYQNQSCADLQSETNRIASMVEKTQKQQIALSSTGINIGLTGSSRYGIFPSISFGVGANDSQRNTKNITLSRLYGEHDAMIIAARQKGCQFAQQTKIYGE